MSDNSFEYDDEQFEGLQGSDLVSALRKQLKLAAKANKTLQDETSAHKQAIADLTQKVNGQTLESALKAKGAKPELAKFMKDVEPTEEAVAAWLAENGELFGYDPKAGEAKTEPEGSSTEGLTPEMIAALATMQKVQQQEANAAPGLLGNDGKVDDFIKRVGAEAKSFDDVAKAFQTAGLFK